MRSQDIRETFLDYFESKHHKIVKSSLLLPQDDPSILFTNAGMNQFKNIFLGLEARSYKRAASVQKCMRVSGKHNDLEQVGRTNKHHTFFEMLGNFSFGDYFKTEAVAFAWELMTCVFRIPAEQLYITVYRDDDEAYRIWEREIGIPENRLFRFGKKDNYWSMGDTGPCGPCSEIHCDLSPTEPGDAYALIESGDDRFMELWNLVFMQFERDSIGKQHPLPSPSIDTGMGLERMAALLQGKDSNYDTDLFLPIILAVADQAGYEYPGDEKSNTALRIIADHLRAITFLVGDGIMPANDGRGYVLRRLIRRAFRQGNALGMDEPFLFHRIGTVCDIMQDAYPELVASAEYIAKVCLAEEQRFARTLTSGLKTFNQFAESANKSAGVLQGRDVFKLYDTFGFPLDLSVELAHERGITVDEAGFQAELEKQRMRARDAWDGESVQKKKRIYEPIKNLDISYVGYDEVACTEVKVLALIKDGRLVDRIEDGENAEIFIEKTPFYAEAGGQIGDAGIMKNSRFSGLVENAFSPIPEIIAHQIKVISGKLGVGERVDVSIDLMRRRAISKNHTATHLLHAALRQVIGDHVKQAGSLVSPERLRFDFTHFSPLSRHEIQQIELLINEKIQDNISVETHVLSLDEGIKSGAMAIFEEKYGEQVRMVSIPGFSKELCGGVHVHRTGDIGFLKIISEASIAAGMRRIEAVTGNEAVLFTQELSEQLEEVQRILSVSRQDIVSQLEKIRDGLKEKEKENRSLRQKVTHLKFGVKKDGQVRKNKEVPVIIRKVEGVNNTELRELADNIKQKLGSGIVILGAAGAQKVFLVASVEKDLSKRVRADDIIKQLAPVIGGGGGGRSEFAQAGGTLIDRLDAALDQAYRVLEGML